MKPILQAFFILIFTANIGACNPLKVTNPSDPKFDIKKFSFSDYKTSDELRDVFSKIFAPDTPKAYVDQVLVEFGGAEISTAYEALETFPKYIYISYAEPVNFLRSIKKPAHHNFIYDGNDRLINIKPFGASKIFKDKPDNRELNEMKHQGDGNGNP